MLTRPLTQPLTGPLVRGVGEGGVNAAPSLNNYSAANPFYIAHRGGSFMGPENTLEAYRNINATGRWGLECDVSLLSDSVLCLMHDTTVDRTTTGTGNVTAFNTAQWQALVVDAGTQLGGQWNDTSVHPPLLSDYLSEFKNRAILVPEAKVTGTPQPLVDALVAADVAKDKVIVQGSTTTAPAAAVVAGYQGMYLTSTNDTAAIAATGIQWVGVDNGAADSVFTAWLATGLKVAAWTVNRRYNRDHLRSLGAIQGFFTDDPQYIGINVPSATTDNFASQTWMPGMLSRFTLLTEADRGRFFAPDYWGFSINTGTAYVLQGWACPIKGNANADTFTIDLKVTFDSAQSGDSTRFASVFVCNTIDYPFSDAATLSTSEVGYHVLLRKSGVLQIYKRTDLAAATLMATGTGAGLVAIADGQEVAFRVTVTPSAVKVDRLDGAGASVGSATTSDTTYRGGYFWLGRNGLACRFRDITIA